MTERDPALERAWREQSRETPPPALDRAILAAAHRAVGSRPQEAKPAEATSPQRWWMPLAAAAAIGTVVVGILQTMPADTNLVMPETSSSGKLAATAPATAARDVDAPAPAEKKKEAEAGDVVRRKEAAVTPAASPAARPTPPAAEPAPRKPQSAAVKRDAAPAREASQAKAEAPRQMPVPTEPHVQAFAQSLPAPAAPPPPAPASRAEAATDAARSNAPPSPEPFPAAAPRTGEGDTRKDTLADKPAAAGVAPGRLAQAPATAAPAAALRARDEMREAAPKPLAKSPANADAQAKARDPDAWIIRIRKLRDEGNTADAIRELREFRDTVPDAERRLPADLLDWAAGLRN